MSDMTSTEKRRHLILLILLVTGIAVSVVLALSFLFAPEKPSATAQSGHAQNGRHFRQGGRRRHGRIQSEAEGTRYAAGQ